MRIVAGYERAAPSAEKPTCTDIDVLRHLGKCLPKHRILLARCPLLKGLNDVLLTLLVASSYSNAWLNSIHVDSIGLAKHVPRLEELE